MSGFQIDDGALDSIANIFRNVSDDVDVIGKSVPGTPDAGDATPAVTGILSHLVENASSLVLGMAGAADDVSSASKTYRENDAAASDDLKQVLGEK